MKIAVLTSYGPTLASVRGPLLSSMIAAGHRVITSAPDCSSSVISDLVKLGVEHRRLPLSRRGLNPVKDAAYTGRLWRFFRSERFDACLLSTIKPVVFGSLAARAARVPRICSLITGLGYSFLERRGPSRAVGAIAEQLYLLALSFNQVVFFQNEDDRSLFESRKLVSPDKTCLVNGSGVDLDFYAATPVPPGPPVFLIIARLLKAKGVREFLSAAVALKREFTTCRFVLIGRPETGPDALPRQAVDELTQKEVIEYWEDVADVRPLLRSCTVFVLPSYREGTARSSLEALATGRALVTTTAPGCRETVIEGVNGFAVPPGNSAALQAAMRRFIDTPSLAERMGKASRRLAEEKFDVREVNRIMMQRMEL